MAVLLAVAVEAAGYAVGSTKKAASSLLVLSKAKESSETVQAEKLVAELSLEPAVHGAL